LRAGIDVQELSKAERAALFKQQNQAKIDAQKAAKEKEKVSKAERAAQQEAQRAAKAAAQGKDTQAPSGAAPAAAPASGASGGSSKAGGSLQHDDPKAMEKAKKSSGMQRTEVTSSKKVPWFQHLPQYERETSLSQKLSKTSKRAHSLRQDNDIHPAILSLGLKFGDWLIVGGNKRTTAMLQAFSKVIMDYQSEEMQTAADLSRHLDARLKPLISYMVACRPLSIGMGNAIRWLKSKIAHLPSSLSIQEGKEHLAEQVVEGPGLRVEGLNLSPGFRVEGLNLSPGFRVEGLG